VGVITGASMSITYLGVVLAPPAFGAVAALMGTFSAAFRVAAVVVVAVSAILLMSVRIKPHGTLQGGKIT
jgi:hypothetical protein